MASRESDNCALAFGIELQKLTTKLQSPLVLTLLLKAERSVEEFDHPLVTVDRLI